MPFGRLKGSTFLMKEKITVLFTPHVVSFNFPPKYVGTAERGRSVDRSVIFFSAIAIPLKVALPPSGRQNSASIFGCVGESAGRGGELSTPSPTLALALAPNSSSGEIEVRYRLNRPKRRAAPQHRNSQHDRSRLD